MAIVAFLRWSTRSLAVKLKNIKLIEIRHYMELRATTLGKRMAQHPYDRVQLLNAGVKVSGDSHEYLIPFNQLLSIHCKRGLVWGSWSLPYRARKLCVCMVPNGVKPSVFTII